MGLTDAATAFLKAHSPLVCVETKRTYPDGTVKHSYYEQAEFSLRNYASYRGMFGDEYPLDEYTLTDGRIVQEYVQAAPWSSGPVFFLALRWKDGEPLPESLWPDDAIDRA